MNFGQALEAVKHGAAIQRAGWNGKGLKVMAQFPDAGSMNTLPYLYIVYPIDAVNTPGARVPWLASQTDIMAEDWSVINDEKIDFNAQVGEAAADAEDAEAHEPAAGDEDTFMTGEIPRT